MTDPDYRDRRRALATAYLQDYRMANHAQQESIRHIFDAGYDAGYQDRDRAVVALREALSKAGSHLFAARLVALKEQVDRELLLAVAAIDAALASPEAGRKESGGE